MAGARRRRDPRRARRPAGRVPAIPPLVIVRFRPGTDVTPVEASAARVRQVDPAQLGDWEGLLRRFPTAQIAPMYGFDDLAAWRRVAHRAAGRRRPAAAPSFELSFCLTVERDHDALARHLAATWPSVERAWVRRGAPSPAIDLGTGGKWTEQLHLDPSTGIHFPGSDSAGVRHHCGVGARSTWPPCGTAGADGADVRFVLVDLGCYTNHADFAGLPWMPRIAGAGPPGAEEAAAGWQDLLVGRQFIPAGEALRNDHVRHGTAMLSLVCARAAGGFQGDPNLHGCVGIAPGLASVGVASSWGIDPDQPQLGVGEYLHVTLSEILKAGVLRPGDVLLLERQFVAIDGKAVSELDSQRPCVPVEADPDVRAQIDLLDAAGIVVVEAAGNSPMNLDTYASPSGEIQWIADPPGPGQAAILVSWAPHLHPIDAGGGTSHTRDPSAPFGTRVDCWGPGADAVAAWMQLGTDPPPAPDESPAYAGATGSSAAAAVVAGVVASMQGMRRAFDGSHLSSHEVRTLFLVPSHGTPWAVPPAVPVRCMPDLVKLAAHGLFGALHHLRGLEAYDPFPDLRPFVSVRLEGVPVLPLDGAVDPPPGVLRGASYELRAGVWNHGAVAGSDAVVGFHWATPATVVTPDRWHWIGACDAGVVPAAGQALAGPVPWTAADVPSSGPCAIAVVLGTTASPPAADPGIATWDDFVRATRADGRAGVRCVIGASQLRMGPDPRGAWLRLPLVVAGAREHTLDFDIRCAGALPPSARVLVVVPPSLSGPAASARRRLIAVPLAGAEFEAVTIAAGASVAAEVRVWIPPEDRTGTYWIDVRQTWEAQEVGRLTWCLVP